MKATDFRNATWHVEQMITPGEPPMYGLWTIISDERVLFLFVDGVNASDMMNCEASAVAIGHFQHVQGNALCNLHVDLYDRHDEDDIPF